MNSIVLVGFQKNHYTLYNYLLNIFSSKYEKVCFISNEETLNNVSVKSFNIKYVEFENNYESKIYRKYKQLINEYEILIIDEYYDRYSRLWNFRFINTTKIMIIHNANKWLRIIPDKFVNFRSLFDRFYRKSFFLQFNGFIVMEENIKNYLKDKIVRVPIFYIPFNSPKENHNWCDSKDGTIRIVIPGTVTSSSRNYSLLLTSIEQFYRDTPKCRIKFILLGKIDRELEPELFERIMRLKSAYPTSIDYWTSFLTDEEFDNIMTASDFVFSNLNEVSFSKDGIAEYVGKTKATGMSFLVYKYSKPAIVPKYHSLTGFESQLLIYNDYSGIIDIYRNIDEGIIQKSNYLESAILNSANYSELVKKETSSFLDFLEGLN